MCEDLAAAACVSTHRGEGPGAFLGTTLSDEAWDGAVRDTQEGVLAGELGTVEVLLSGGAEVSAMDARGMVPLHWASRAGDLPIVQLLLKVCYGAPPAVCILSPGWFERVG